MTSIRGAITAESNTSGAILEAAEALLLGMAEANNLNIDQIIDIIFSATKDLNAAYPAAAARKMGIVEAGLFCVQEMDVSGSLPMCLRVLLHAEIPGKKQSDMKHVYLKEAKCLRPDLIQINKFPAMGSGDKSPVGDGAKPHGLLAIAIDGPSGAGKSTVAKAVAACAGIIYVDTGAMYRAVALHNIHKGIDPRDQDAVEKSLPDISIDIRHDSKRSQRLILNGEDVTESLRTQQVAEGSSIVASYQTVRQKLVTLQQSLASKHSVVMDGRDIGTHVLPEAQIKIYLDASLEERIHRRVGELQASGQPAEYASVKTAIEIRDNRDMNRTHAPLTQAKDAIYIKSDGMTVQDITQMIIQEIGKVR